MTPDVNKECNCDMLSRFSTHAHVNTHSVNNVWHCPIHGYKDVITLLHKEKDQSCVVCNPKESESWEKDFSREFPEWKKQNAQALHVKSFITSLLKRQEETVYDEIERVVENMQVIFKEDEKYLSKRDLLTQIQAKRDNNGTIPN